MQVSPYRLHVAGRSSKIELGRRSRDGDSSARAIVEVTRRCSEVKCISQGFVQQKPEKERTQTPFEDGVLFVGQPWMVNKTLGLRGLGPVGKAHWS